MIVLQDVCSDEAALGGLREAALQVARSLDDLMNHIRRGTTTTYQGTQVSFARVFIQHVMEWLLKLMVT